MEFADVVLRRQLPLEPYNTEGGLIWSVAVPFTEGTIPRSLGVCFLIINTMTALL